MLVFNYFVHFIYKKENCKPNKLIAQYISIMNMHYKQFIEYKLVKQRKKPCVIQKPSIFVTLSQ